jgi:hypothetical protein
MRIVDCAEVRDAFRAGLLPVDSSVVAHVRQCPRCTELFADDARLGRALGSEQPLTRAAPALWSQIEDRLRGETGVRAWLRSRSTLLRVALAAAVGALVVLIAHGGKHVGLMQRGGHEPIAWITAFALLGVTHIALSLRPLGRAGISGIGRAALLLGAFSLPLLYALTAPADTSALVPFLGEAVACFTLGIGLALPFVGALRAIDRRDRLTPWGIVLIACAGGLLANLGLALRCPVHEQGHLLLGHAPVALGIGLGLVAARRLGARRPAR